MKARNFLALVSLFILLPSFGLAQGGWITLPGQAFIARHSDVQWDNITTDGGECYLFGQGTGVPRFFAPVIFPQGADGLSVRQINATVGDNDAVHYVWIRLYRMNRYSGINHIVYDVKTGSANTPGKIVITDNTGAYRLIDSQKYAWFVHVYFTGVPTPPQNIRLYAIRIRYQ